MHTIYYHANMRFLGILVFISVILLHSATFAQQKPLVIGIPCLNADQCKMVEVENLLREAYSRIGAEVEFRYLPMKRDLEEANRGLIDGSAFRSRIGLGAFPDLIPIPTPLASLSFVAFMTNPDIRVMSWSDLRGLRVGIMRGDMIGTIMTRNEGIKAHPVTSLAHGFRMLKADRLDVFVYEQIVGTLQAKALKMDNVIASPPLYRGYTYHALNDRHADLVPQLEKALKDMIEDGTSAKLFGKYLEMMPAAPFDLE